MAMMAGLSQMMAPAMLGMAVGSMVGHLATRAFGTHDLPIPRQPATVTLVPSNIDGFATDWEIPVDEMRLWVLAHEFAGHALFAATHVRDALSDLVRQHVGGFRPDPNAVADRLGSLDSEAGDPMAALQQALGDPGGAARRGHVARAAGAAAAPRRPRRRRRRLHRLDRRRRRRAGRRRQRPADRRGRAPAPGRDHVERLVRRAAPRHPPRRRPGRPRQGVRPRRRRPRRRRRDGARSCCAPTPSRRRARSTPPACWLARIEA